MQKRKKWVFGVLLLFALAGGLFWNTFSQKKQLLDERSIGRALVTILLSEATDNRGKFPASYQEMEALVEDKSWLYQKDGVTPRWIYHPSLTTSDADKVILESVPDSQGGRIRLYVGGDSEYVREK